MTATTLDGNRRRWRLPARTLLAARLDTRTPAAGADQLPDADFCLTR